MNKTIIFASILLCAGYFMASCSNKDEAFVNVPVENNSVTIHAGISEDTSTRIALGESANGKTKVLWSAGDAFILTNENNSFIFNRAIDDTEEVANAYFTYSDSEPLPEITTTGLTFCYPATGVPTDYAYQTGTEEGLSDYMVMTATVPNGTSSWEDLHLSFKHSTAVVKMILTNEAFKSKNVTVSLNATGLLEYSTFITSDELNADEKGTVVAYFAVPATDELSNCRVVVTCNGTKYEATLGAKSIAVGKLYTITKRENQFVKIENDDIPYLTFSADAMQTLTISQAVETLEYSVDNGDWAELGTNTVSFGGELGNLRVRGKSSFGTATKLDDLIFFILGNDVEVLCNGDIRTLVDYENYATTNTSKAKFIRLFYGCTSLITAPSLPAENLAEDCYFGMFMGCTNLKNAPELPAMKLAGYCYESMFSNCSSLTKAPQLPATELASACYRGMFQNCVNLTTPPELPATKLTWNCYYRMFEGCSSLTTAPSLPATELAYECYYSMFINCSKLTTAPELPATKLIEYCYYRMFEGCSSLTKAPQLPATTLAPGCYSSMFEGCSSLTKAPQLPATTLAPGCYSSMFEGCTNLTKSPILPATTLAENCYSAMFVGCLNLNEITMLAPNFYPQNSFNAWVYGVSSKGIFIKSKELKSMIGGNSGIPSDWTVIDYNEE